MDLLKRVRGTTDLLDTKAFNLLMGKFKSHLSLYGFEEIILPVLEHTSLFEHSLGEATDVVNKEMYTFESSGSEKSICLRPEATAQTVRAYLENNVEKKPWKTFLVGPMFRRERPQKGRWREFYQMNAEVVGTDSIFSDIQFISMLDKFFDSLELNDRILHLNYIGSIDDRKKYSNLLFDFLEKNNGSLCETCNVRMNKNIMRVFDCKSEICGKICSDAPKIVEHLEADSLNKWESLKDALDSLSVNYSLNSTLVRGLDYYSGTVFEFTSGVLGAQNAFCGGGRYDLGMVLGNKPVPSIGAAIGVGRLLIMLEKNKEKESKVESTSVLVIPIDEDQKKMALSLAEELRTKKIKIDVIFDGKSLKSMMRHANKIGVSHVLIIGEEEQKNGTVALKDMVTGKSEVIKQKDCVDAIASMNRR